tara:strand:- start:492 stop:773 length:282 start_codon:yes stop_codon:yes gene_type:complete
MVLRQGRNLELRQIQAQPHQTWGMGQAIHQQEPPLHREYLELLEKHTLCLLLPLLHHRAILFLWQDQYSSLSQDQDQNHQAASLAPEAYSALR